MAKFKIPYHKETGQPAHGDAWFVNSYGEIWSKYYQERYALRVARPFVSTLKLVDWFSSRSTGGLVFEDIHGIKFRFTVRDMVEMIPHMNGDTISGRFGWKKQGTAIYNTWIGPEDV